MNHIFKKLIILISLVVVWGAFLFYFQNIYKPETKTFTQNNNIDIVLEKYSSRIHDTLKNTADTTESLREKCGEFYCYSSEEFLELYNNFEIQSELSILPKYIYNNKTVDDYLQTIAETLGYRKRVFAYENVLVSFENIITRSEVRDAYKEMRNEMKGQGILLHFVSGYRNSESQRSIFKRKASIDGIEHIPTGLYDAQIYETLSRSALPGYSKHHSGYAVDFGCGTDYLVYSFAETECYEWMSGNNFENTKKFGFIPSYPEGVENQGPNPEPWEFVWIGVENLI